MNNSQVAIFGRFYELLAVTLLFTTNAYLLLVDGWFRSFKVVPANGLAVEDVSNVLTKNLGQFFIAAIEVAGPVLGCLFLAEVVLGVLSRAAPSLNVFALAFPLRVVIALIAVGLAHPARSAPRSATSCTTPSRRSATADPESGDMAAGDKGDKTEKPTPKRVKEARDKGQIARSPDLAAWVSDLRDDGAAPDDRQARHRRLQGHPRDRWASRSRTRTKAWPRRFAADAMWKAIGVVAPMLVGMLVDRAHRQRRAGRLQARRRRSSSPTSSGSTRSRA